jgi:uncharacterized membrane protein YqiK
MAEIAAPIADAPVIDATAPVTPPAPVDPEELTRTKSALKAANKEAETHRLKLAAYEKAETEKAEAEMSESQKAIARAEKAEARINELAPLSETVEKYKGALQAHVKPLVEKLPAHVKVLVMALDPIAQLDYITKNGDALGLTGQVQSTGGASPTKGTRPTTQTPATTYPRANF